MQVVSASDGARKECECSEWGGVRAESMRGFLVTSMG